MIFIMVLASLRRLTLLTSRWNAISERVGKQNRGAIKLEPLCGFGLSIVLAAFVVLRRARGEPDPPAQNRRKT